MEVRTGYKQTEVGELPADWSLDFIENVALITTGSKNTQDRIDDGAYPFFVRSQKVERINSYSFDGEAVLTAGDGVGTGKVFHYIKGKFDVHQRVYRISDFSERIDGYFFYLYFSTHFYNRIMQMTAKSSVDSVRRDMIARMVVPFPSTKAEQRAIATALSDVDALLDGLTQLIAKKRDLKHATMQQLLAGRTRLPGFSGEWETKQLGDLAQLSKAGVDPSATPEALFTQFSLPAFDAGRTPSLETGASIGSNKFVVPKNAVLLSKLNPRIPRVWAPHEIPDNSVCSTEFLVLVPKHAVDRSFLFCVCQSPNVSAQMEQHAIGTTGSHQRIHPAQALAITVFAPTDVSEQTAIAKVFADMDAEVAALEARLAKTRALKQAMMQELLTGKTRLLAPEPAHA